MQIHKYAKCWCDLNSQALQEAVGQNEVEDKVLLQSFMLLNTLLELLT